MSDENETISLSPAETLHLTREYRHLEGARHEFEMATAAVNRRLAGIFVARELPEELAARPWMLEVDGEDVNLIPPPEGADVPSE